MIRFIILSTLTLLCFFYAKYSFEFLTGIYFAKQEEFLLMLISILFAHYLERD